MNVALAPEWYWVAGVIEGEGCLGWNRPQTSERRYLQLSVNMTDLDVLERLQAITGVGNIVGPYAKPNPAHKPMYRWRVGIHEDVVRIVENIMPLLLSRRAHHFTEMLATRAQQKAGR